MFWASVLFVVGFALGIFFAVTAIRMRSSGSLMVDTSDPDGPYLFLELTSDPNEVLKKTHVTLSVKLNNRHSRN